MHDLVAVCFGYGPLDVAEVFDIQGRGTDKKDDSVGSGSDFRHPWNRKRVIKKRVLSGDVY